MTCKDLIMDCFKRVDVPMAVHEVHAHVPEYSENNLATRLNELERAGRLASRYRKGFQYKEWFLNCDGKQLLMM